MAGLIDIAIFNALAAPLVGVIAWQVQRRFRNARLAHALWVLVLVRLVIPLPPMGPGADWFAFSFVRLTSFNAGLGEPTQPTPVLLGPTNNGRVLMQCLLGISLGGALLLATVRIYATWKIFRLVNRGVPNPRVDRLLHRLARRAQIANYPTARVVPWVVSPMLWGVGGASVIVLPHKLLEVLDNAQIESLLLHELGHFQRGDQWVRILEGITSTLFWWHPLVWITINQIEVCEEQCCDFWVITQSPTIRRAYAKALADTVDFIVDSRELGPPLAASGLGQVRMLQRRLAAILHQEPSRSYTAPWVVLVALICFSPHYHGLWSWAFPPVSHSKPAETANTTFRGRDSVAFSQAFRLVANVIHP